MFPVSPVDAVVVRSLAVLRGLDGLCLGRHPAPGPAPTRRRGAAGALRHHRALLTTEPP